MLRLATLLVALAFVGGALPAGAQRASAPGPTAAPSTPAASTATPSATALGVLISHSASSDSPVTQALALTTVEVEWTLPVCNGGGWGLEYAAAGIVAAVQENPTGVIETSSDAWVVWNPPPAGTTFGVGLRGLGMRAWMGPERLRLQADVAGGFLYFGTPLLAANATRFNFTGTAGLGLRVAAGDGHIVLGYRIQHLSNGGLGEVNPGMDAHQVYLGAWVR